MPGGKAAAGRKERFLFSASRDEKPPGKELKKITTERVMANQGMDNKCHVRHHVAFELGLGARPPPSKGTMVVCRSTDLEVLVHMQTEHPKSNAKIAISENFIHLYERGGRYPVVRTKDGRVFLVLQFDQKTLQELKQQMNLPKHHTRHVDLDIHLSVTSRGVSYYHISAVQLFAKNEGYKNTRRSKEPSPAPSAAAAAAATGGAARGGKGGKGASTMSDQHRLLLAQQQQQQQQQASQMYLQQFQQQQLQQLQQLQQQQQQQQQQQKQLHHHHQQQQALPPRRRSQRLSADRMPGMSTAATSSSSFPFPDPNEIFGYGRPKRQSASQRGGAQGQQPPHSARSIGSLGGLFSPTMQMDTGGSGGAGNSVPLFSPSFLNYGGVPLPTPTEDLEMPSPFNRLSFDESYGSGSGLLASLGDAGGSGAAAAAAGDGSQQSQSQQQQQQPDSALFAMAPFQSNGMAAPFPPATAKSSAASDTGTPNVPLATSTSSAPARRSSMRSSTSSHSSKRRRKEPHLPAPLSLGSISNKAAPAASSPTTRSVRAAAAAASSASAASDITAGPPSAMLPIPPTPSSAVQPAQIPITPATGQAPGAEHINAASVLASIKSTPPSTPQGGGAPAASAGTNGGRFSFERRSSTGSNGNGTRKRKRRGSSAATTPTATN